MLVGAGGNDHRQVGSEGVLPVDTLRAALEQILAAIHAVAGPPHHQHAQPSGSRRRENPECGGDDCWRQRGRDIGDAAKGAQIISHQRLQAHERASTDSAPRRRRLADSTLSATTKLP
jgi:hypothetical protein